jgi:hypothetical protein
LWRRKAAALRRRKFGIGVLASVQETGIVPQHPHDRCKLKISRRVSTITAFLTIIGAYQHRYSPNGPSLADTRDLLRGEIANGVPG